MRSKQRGVFLIGATIAVAVAGLLIAFWGRHQMQQMRIEKGERVGEALKVLGNHVQDFMVEHHGKIKDLLSEKESSITLTAADGAKVRLNQKYNGALRAKSIVDLTPEKLTQLTGAKGIGASPPLAGAQYRIVIYSDNCENESKPCDINSVTYLTAPIKSTYSSEVDWVASGAALTKLGVLGGISQANDPNTLRFLDGNGAVINSVRNPAPIAIAGLLAIRGGYQTSAQDAFLRRDGSRAMSGHLQMGKKDIVNARNITAAGRVESDEISASSVIAKKKVVVGFENRVPDGVDDKRIKQTEGGVIAEGEVYAGKDVTAEGNVYAGKNMEAKGGVLAKSVTTTGDISAGGAIVGKRATINGRLEVKDADLWTYGDIWAKRKLWSGSGVIRLDGQVNGACAERGIGLDEKGRVMSCQGGKWQLGSLPKDSSEVPDELREKIEAGGRAGYVKWEVVSGTFNAHMSAKVDCKSSTRVEVFNGFACQIDVLKNYCDRPPQLVRRSRARTTQTYEIPAAGTGSGGIGGAVFKLTCLARDAGDVTLKYVGDGTPAYVKLLDKSYGKKNIVTEEDLATLIGRARQPELAANVLIEKFRCWIGDAGETYNLDKEAGGPWDYCEMAADEGKYHCDQPNQRRALFRDVSTGAWMLSLKQRSAGAKCVKFAH